ncbi:hypothetical protein [Microcystis aeruginosa]|uniref:hypothetical protein n=1 Tax=Microcystis aeruginosa TaxID=1126 RepID=UPI0026D36C0A|nr:hypothetical protein [Microcystis aeruginosa]
MLSKETTYSQARMNLASLLDQVCDESQIIVIENLGLKPRRSTTALPLNISAFTRYMLECEIWKKPILTDFTRHQNKSRYCGALWDV